MAVKYTEAASSTSNGCMRGKMRVKDQQIRAYVWLVHIYPLPHQWQLK